MASYSLNHRAVDKCRRLIDAGQYVLDSDWGEGSRLRLPGRPPGGG